MWLPYAIRAGIQMSGNIGDGSAENSEFPLMDFKASCKSDTWLFGASDSSVLPAGTILSKDQMGNYMAGYTAGYSDNPTILYAGVRVGGIIYARSGSSEGKWDQESVPDIRNGFIDGYVDFCKAHPCRGVIRSVMPPRILPLMILLDSFY